VAVDAVEEGSDVIKYPNRVKVGLKVPEHSKKVLLGLISAGVTCACIVRLKLLEHQILSLHSNSYHLMIIIVRNLYSLIVNLDSSARSSIIIAVKVCFNVLFA